MTALRRTQAVVLSVALAVVAPAVPAAAAGPAGWDHPGFDAEDSYYNPGENAVNATTIAKLSQRWSVALRKHEGSCGGFGAPVIAGGRVVTTDQLGISAFQALTGAPAWHFNWVDPGDSDTAVLAASGNTMIATNGDCNSNSDPDGTLVALDLATGKRRWWVDSDMPIYTVVVDKGMIVVSGESPSDAQAVVAYRVSDGKQAWKRVDYEGSSVCADGRVLVNKGTTTSALSITTGALLWTKPGYWQAKAATPAADRFLVTNGAAMSAINAANGAVMWTAPNKASDLLATDGRRIYRVDDHTVEALDVNSGRSLWSRGLPSEGGQPVRAGGLLYTGGPVLSPTSGAIVAQAKVLTGRPVITGGRLYTVNDGMLSNLAP
ncbi:PQQ-binding-like beta-propeller repeat protein [Actinoplanes sp. NPDC026619]|uniref:outer membrane protein assembly factor BamB family protein n=1 Tax=Actinoplanes sp. NPDC026619 TaxID=3155798 RepID=UPI0033EF6E14